MGPGQELFRNSTGESHMELTWHHPAEPRHRQWLPPHHMGGGGLVGAFGSGFGIGGALTIGAAGCGAAIGCAGLALGTRIS